MSSLPEFGLLLRRRDPTNFEKRPLCMNKEIRKISPCEIARIMTWQTRDENNCFTDAPYLLVCSREILNAARSAREKKNKARI